MKRLLILILLFTTVNTFAQVKVGADGNIIPTGIYPAAKSTDLKGTIHLFKTITDRNNLPANFRDTGMLAYVRDSLKFYYLYNGITNADWKYLVGMDTNYVKSVGISSIYKSLTDSVFFVKNNQIYFAFKDSSLAPIAITTNHAYPVQSIADMLALSALIGDVAVVADSSKSYILRDTPAVNQSNWLELKSPTLASTDYLLEGTTNLYSTVPRIRDAITGGVGIDYSKITGVIDNQNPYPFNAIQGENISITGTYPNKTFSVTGVYTQAQIDSIKTVIQTQTRQDISDSTALVQNGAASYTGLTSTGGITLVDSTLTIHEDIKWTVVGVDYIKSSPSVFIINTEDSGYYRRDLIYADKTGTLYKIVGVHDQTVGVAPHLPDSAVTVTIVDVYGDQIFPPEPIIISKGKNPTLQQVTNRGNTTTDQIIDNYNGGGFGFTQNSSKNGYTGMLSNNTSNGTGAGAGFLAQNNVGHIGQIYMGSNNNAYIADGLLIRSSGASGMRLSADIGAITFGRGLRFLDNNPPVDYARFDNNGTFNLFNYKNSIGIDSFLTTDMTGKVIFKKVTTGTGTDNAAYHTATQGSDSLHYDLNRPDGTGTVFKFVFDTANGGGGTGGNYTLPIASASILGGVKIGSGLNIDVNGVLSSAQRFGKSLEDESANSNRLFNVAGYSFNINNFSDFLISSNSDGSGGYLRALSGRGQIGYATGPTISSINATNIGVDLQSFNTGNDQLDFNLSPLQASLSIKKGGVQGGVLYFLPPVTPGLVRYSPLTVNGVASDSTGNITLDLGGGGSGLSRFGAEDHLGLENRNFILPDNTFTVQVGDTNVIDRYSRVNITKYGTSIQSTDSSQNYDVSMNVNSDGAQFNLYNSRSQIGRAYFQGVSNGNGVYMESDSIFYRTTRFSIYQLVPAITYTNSAQQVSKLVFPYFNDQTTKYSPLSVNGNYADASGNITISTGAGSAYTASNGLTMSGSDMQLGGTLLNNTTLTTGVYTLALTGTQTSLSVDVTANNTSSIISSINGNNSTAIYGTAYGGSNVNSVGVKGNASNGIGGLFESSRYNSLDVNLPLEAGIYQDSSSIKPIFNLSRHKDQNFSDGTIVSNGFGGSLNFLLEAERDNLGNVDTYTANSLISKWTKTNPSDLSYTSTSEFQITGLLNNNIVTLLTLNGNGLIKLNQGLTNYANNAAAIAGGLTVGQLYRNGDIVQIVH